MTLKPPIGPNDALSELTTSNVFSLRASGGDDAPAIIEALLTKSVFLPDPLYLIGAEIVVPNTRDLNGGGLEATKIRPTAIGADIRFVGRGGRSGNFYFDGTAVSTNAVIFECTEREIENIRAVDTLGDLFKVGTLTATAQNNKFLNVKGHNCGGSVWMLDGGAGNNDFFGIYGERAARYVVEIKRSGASPSAGFTQPTNNRFYGGIIERPVTRAPLAITNGLGVVLQTSGSDNEFYGTTLSCFGIAVVDMPLIEVKLSDAGASVSRMGLNGNMFLDGNSNTTTTGLKVGTSGELTLNGRTHLRSCLYGLDFDDTATVQVDRIRWGNPIANRYRQRGTQKAHQRVTDLIDPARSADWPTNSITVTSDRTGRAWQQQAIVSGTLIVCKIQYPVLTGVPISEIHFVSGGTALVGGNNQWACLMDSTFNVLASTNDELATAWAGDTDKTFTIASPYVPTTDFSPLVGLLVNAATPPNIAGIAHGRVGVQKVSPPRMYSGSGASAGLTTPASLATPVTGLSANAVEIFAFLK